MEENVKEMRAAHVFKTKTGRAFFILFVLSGIASCALFLPAVRGLVIRLVEELLLHRKLNNIPHWDSFLFRFPFTWNGLWLAVFFIARAAKATDFFACTKAIAQECMFMVKPALILFGIYCIACTALLRANFSFVDDQARVMKGWSGGWFSFGRYLDEILSRVIHADLYLADISPLTHIIAIAIMAVSAITAAFVLLEKKKLTAIHFIALIPFALSPYYLECLSYKYDSPYMALSVFAAVAPLLFAKQNVKHYCIAIIIGVLVSCTAYQVSLGIFPMLVIALCLKRWLSGENAKDVLQFLGISAAVYLLTVVFFKIFLAPVFNDYVNASLPSLGQFFPTVCKNYIEYFSLLFSDFKTEWMLYVAVLTGAYIFLCIKNSAQKALSSILITCTASVLMILLMFSVYPAFVKPLFAPRAMYGTGMFISVIALLCCTFPHRNILPKAMTVLLGWSFFTFAFVYGNALHEQNEYTDFRIESVLDDIKNMEIQNPAKVYIVGTIGHSPVIEHMPARCGIIRRLVPVAFRENNMWGMYKINEYYKLKQLTPLEFSLGEQISPGTYAAPDSSAPSFTTLKDTIYHTIKTDGSCLVIELK